MQNCCKRHDTIITKADKGGAAVITDADDYVREANRQLENSEFYDTNEANPIKVNRTIS